VQSVVPVLNKESEKQEKANACTNKKLKN